MSGKISLILGFHEHLSPGGPDGEFEELCASFLKPLIMILNDRPEIHAVLHLSGPLLEKLEQKKREFFLLIGDLASRRRVEVLGGGFYEPPFPLLPPADKIGQIEMLTTYLRKHFGKKPQGCYLPFGLWEQSLTGTLSSCGMAYTFLDADHFRAAGLEGEKLFFPRITEDQGKLISVFSVFSSLEDILSVPENFSGRRAAALFPRFPRSGTIEAMNAFFEELSRRIREKTLELSLPGKALRAAGPLERSYFSPSGERHFLIEYGEANGLYSKMLWTHSLINQLRGDKARKQAAREELWKAQRAEIFYRTGERDLSFPEIRNYSYRALLSAERTTREKGKWKPSLVAFDFDLDGISEYLFQDEALNCYVRTRGASLFELDYLPKAWNYLDTFSGGGLFSRGAFMDCFLDAGVSAVSAAAGNGSRFCAGETFEASVDKIHNKVLFRLLPKKGIPFGAVEMEKIYQVENNVLSLLYTLHNRGDEDLAFSFVPRIDLAFAGPRSFSVSTAEGPLQKDTAAAALERFEVADTKNGAIIGISSKAPFDLAFSPVTTPSGAGNAETYQSTCFSPLFRLALKGGESWSTEFALSIRPLKK